MCVCGNLSVYVSHDVGPGDLTMEDWCHTNNIFAGTLLGMSSCASYVLHTHNVIGDATRSQSKSNFKLMYLRQYLSESVDQKLKMSEMLMAIFPVYSTSCITYGKKSLSRAQNGGHFENFEIWNTASIWPQIWKDCPKLCQFFFFFSWWWHHQWRHGVASKCSSIFMFMRAWLREQVARAMSLR